MSYVIGEVSKIGDNEYKVVILLDQVESGSKLLVINPDDTAQSFQNAVIVDKISPIRFVVNVPFEKVLFTLLDSDRNRLQQSMVVLSAHVQTMYFVSCDHPEADTERTLWWNLYDEIRDKEEMSMCIHLGDNVYADHAWNQCRRARQNNGGAFENFYRARYRQTWFQTHKRRILSSIPNLMIWDDHEIVNNIDLSQDQHPEISAAAINVYEEYQESLHLEMEKFLDRGWFKFVGNILVVTIERNTSGIPRSQRIVDRLEELMTDFEDNEILDEIGGMVVCTTWAPIPPPEENRSARWYRRLYGDEKFQDKKELSVLYDYLLEWSTPSRPVALVGGDIHFGFRGSICRGDKSISVMVASAITNHPTCDRRLAARAFRGTIPIDDDSLVEFDKPTPGYKSISDELIYLNVLQSEGRRCYGRLHIERYQESVCFVPRIIYSRHRRPLSYLRYFRSLKRMW